MAWISSWFSPNKSPNMILEETDNKLVYDDKSKQWVYQNQLDSNNQSSSPQPPLSPNQTSSPLPPVASPPVVINQPNQPCVSGRRPRYIDPFTQEVHQTAPPVVDVATQPQT
ncbi:Uncharacterized protein QTN25_007686 [Entamoeba marina]